MSRLYPGWGSGKESLEEVFTVYPLACLGKDDLEAGDKIILPQSTFRKVSKLKLAFPLTFEVTNPRVTRMMKNAAIKKKPTAIPNKSNPIDTAPVIKRKEIPKQYCGVVEFSAPEEKVFIPYWMMRNLRVKEGQKIQLNSIPVKSLQKGTFCKLQPHETAFIDIAAGMDIRELFEQSFRNYSALTKGETIVVSCFGTNFKIDVVETQPADAISLYGNLDLEVDFAPPLDAPQSGDVREEPPAVSRVPANPHAASRVPANVTGFGSMNQSPKPQAHNWGAAGNGVSTELVGKPRQRTSSKFGNRTQGHFFKGDGASVAANGARIIDSAIVAGRRLQGGEEEDAKVPNPEDMRARRLKFLDNLENAKKEEPATPGSEGSTPRIAVGSSLNAIRRAKT